MGNNCGSHPPPDTSNQCLVPVGDRSTMANFCAPISDSQLREQFTAKMSTAGEWGNSQTTGGLCNMDSCTPGLKVPPGSCGNCFGVVGSGLSSERLSFTGDPVQCCFNNMECVDIPSQTENLCFSDTNHNNTCSDGLNGQPNHRNIISTDCQDALFEYCTGTLSTDDPNSTEWMSRWTSSTNNCYDAMMKNVLMETTPGNRIRSCFSPPVITSEVCGLDLPPGFSINSEGYYWATNLVQSVMTKYQNQGFTIGSIPGLPGWNPFQEFLYDNVCCPYPGLCQQGLEDVCVNHDTTRISYNTSLLQWCGCHLREDQYSYYSDKFGIRKECTPVCNRADVIPITGLSGNNVRCQSDVCLIDNISVNIINSSTGGVSFDQVCGSCPSGSCACVVSDTTISIIDSTVGGQVVPILQNCSSLSCNQTNPSLTGPTLIPVPCTEDGPSNPFESYDERVTEAEDQAKRDSMFYTMVGVGLGLLIAFGMIVYANRKK